MTFAAKTKCLSIVSVILVASTLGCSKSNADRIQEYRATLQLDSVPNVPTKLGVSFGDQITLLGYSLDTKGPLHAKDKVKITYYWRLDKKVEPGWRLSSRVIGERNETLINADDIGKLRERHNRKQLLAPSEWVVGKVYVDEQSLRLPARLPGKSVRFMVAIRKAEESLKPQGKEVDKRGYLTVAQLPIEVKYKATLVPQLGVPLLESSETIKLDGKLDEAAWATAASLPLLGNLVNGRPPTSDVPISAQVKLLWNDRALYMAFDVRDNDIDGGFKKTAKEPLLWKRDALEFIFKTDDKADNKNYYRIAVGPQNLVFDSVYDDFAVPSVPELGPVGDLSWSSKVKVATQLSGTLDDASDEDQGYVQELEVPWASFDRNKDFVVRAGASVWLNFAVWSQGNALGYSPHLGDKSLQVARRFGKIVLVPAGTPPAAPEKIQPLTKELPPAQAAILALTASVAGAAAPAAGAAAPAAGAAAPAAGAAAPAADKAK